MSEEKSLNKQIAELLGWTVVKGRDGYWRLLDGDGNPRGSYIGESEAWKHAGDYEHDLNAVAATLQGHDVTLELDFSATKASIIDWAAARGMRTDSDKAETIAEAAAQVLFRWLQQYPARTPPPDA